MHRPRDLALDLGVVGLAAALVAPLWTRGGYGLARDMVFVPRFALTDDAVGAGSVLPRAVPLDAVLGFVTVLVDGAVVFRIVVLGVLVLAGCGAHRLGRDLARPARILLAVAAVWNPYVVERMSMGQWALLASYAALWWLLPAARAAVEGDRGALLACLGWLTLAALTPTGGLLALLVVLAVVAVRWHRAGGRHRGSALLGVAVLCQLPWVVPSLLGASAAVSDPAGVAAFAARGPGPGGVLPALLTGGGIWNPSVVPATATTWWGLLGAAVAVLALLAGGRLVLAEHPDLVVAGAVGFALALLPALPGGEDLVAWCVEHVPGCGLLRDSQKLLAPYVLLLVLCTATTVHRVAGPEGRRSPSSAEARLLVTVSAAILPLVLLPDAPREVWPTVRPVGYPGDIARAVATLDEASPSTGDVVTLPWASYRRFSWGNDLSAADPVSRWADHAVVVRSDLAVPGGVVLGEDERAAEVGAVVQGSQDDLVTGLRDLGVGWVLVYEGSVPAGPSVPETGLPGLHPVVDGADVALYRVEGAEPTPAPDSAERAFLLALDAAWLLAGVLGALGAVVLGRRAKSS